jgi:hypothetical protein
MSEEVEAEVKEMLRAILDEEGGCELVPARYHRQPRLRAPDRSRRRLAGLLPGLDRSTLVAPGAAGQ